MWDGRFESVLRPHLRFLGPTDGIEPDAVLRSLGVNSMEVVQLILDIEDEFGIIFPDDLLREATFRTPATLWNAIVLLRTTDNSSA